MIEIQEAIGTGPVGNDTLARASEDIRALVGRSCRYCTDAPTVAIHYTEDLETGRKYQTPLCTQCAFETARCNVGSEYAERLIKIWGTEYTEVERATIARDRARLRWEDACQAVERETSLGAYQGDLDMFQDRADRLGDNYADACQAVEDALIREATREAVKGV